MKKGEGVFNVVVVDGGQLVWSPRRELRYVAGRPQLDGWRLLNFGCVPSKALISSAQLIQQIRDAEKWGLDR